MSFVRSKEIPPGSGNWYDYEVMGVRVGNKVRQKHIQYLGKHGGILKPLIGDVGLAEHRVSVGATNPDTATPAASAPTTPMADPTRIPKMKTPARLIASALGMYYGGMSLDASSNNSNKTTRWR